MAGNGRALLSVAERADRVSAADPERALALAATVLEDAGVGAEAAAVAERALGVSCRVRGDLVSAEWHLRRSLALATEPGGARRRTAETRAALGVVLALRGDVDEALALLDSSVRLLRGAAAAGAVVVRSVILQRLGRSDEAMAGYRRALGPLRRAGDVGGQARLLGNRGVLHAYRGDFRAAEADLRAAAPIYASLGERVELAGVHHNLGFVAARRGDVPTALRCFDLAESEWRALGISQPATLLDRCETLLAVRLVAEARQVGAAAVAGLEAAGAEIDLAEARLLLSQAALLDGDRPDADRLAALARRAFVAQRRAGWAALARYAQLRAAWAEGEGTAALVAEAQATVADLAAAGWAVPTQDARLIAARIALDAGRPEEAGRRLREASAARFRGPADVRARAWHAEALTRRASGDGRGAEAALRAGIRVLARNRATLGATELRVHATARVADLGRLGMRMALESGRARRVLAWAERLRGDWSQASRPPRPPDDAEVADHLAELRFVVSRLEAASFAGEDPGRLLRRQAMLEDLIRRKTRHAVGKGRVGDPRPASTAALGAGLGDRALVEVVECDGELSAVSLVDGRARLHHLGREAETTAAADTLRFALGRLARARQSLDAQQAAAALAQGAAERLDQVLFGAVASRVGDRPLVVVPTGRLHALPWSSLPSCRSRSVVVAPSAGAWLRASSAGASGGEAPGTVLVAGPGLAQARREVAELARVHSPAATLSGAGATTDGFLRVADGARLVHVAAHGRFRADNPLLSSLRLADGPLTVYDLERLDTAPRHLVLSACEGGLSASHPGDELMGLASTLLGLGTRSLVASVVPVRDATTRPLMVELHRLLAAGTAPGEALASALVATAPDGPDALSAVGFVCFGAG
ncbi:MAG: CHAT domain-containing protein [Acidimicrobiales bacterium]